MKLKKLSLLLAGLKRTAKDKMLSKLAPGQISCTKENPDRLATSRNGDDVDEVRFLVGQDEQQCITAQKSKLAVNSQVFDAMFNGSFPLESPIRVPDIEPEAFEILIRYTPGANVQLKDSTVWFVLRAADKYEVIPLVELCFRHLIFSHKDRKKGDHICAVMELAHRLNDKDHYKHCLDTVLKNFTSFLGRKSCLAELCYDCMLNIVKDDRLAGIGESFVNEMVITWAQCACRKMGVQNPSFEDLRCAAKDLIKYVRYLALPSYSLRWLKPEVPCSCLLTREEMKNLKSGGSMFPPEVGQKRKKSSASLRKDKRKFLKEQ